ncbi:aminopeptidase N [Nanchangia anserum]|uniref:Aminopeptidase N n=1 Tax=Nanchangia anserum TaxID=2692125 RepID=A0A8I0GAY8_9ACTO|nr:aminopeptidase N [Nanchangia anserum]MBD3688810.1 aminopeptidase N [Nanchangia anserum]QOX81088.1 aminopeptidase N [Nanchangia anserum]
MSVLTRTQAAHRSESVTLTAMEVDVDLTGATGEETSYPVTSTFTLSVDGGDLMIDIAGEVVSVEIDGTTWPYERDEHHIYLADVPDGEIRIRVQARCAYSTNGQGLHRYVDPEDGRVYCYTHFEPMDAHTAWPCLDQPDLKASWTFHVHAPQHWIVRANQPTECTRRLGETALTWDFAPTPPLSAYLTCVIGGDYHEVRGTPWRGTCAGRDLEIELTYLCRAALAVDLDVDDIERVTHQGLSFFMERYRFAYPWGKYDQVFVPEYNIGAMENPGLVTFNEHYIRRGGPTRASRQALAGTVLHEMCHMWFGDLVTPRWWDDLWLKESFADHEGTEALTHATEYATGWSEFTLRREGWAHVEDQLPTTHPILATIDDVEAAKQNFDGITYAKGACVLRQLVTWVGHDHFVEATRRYFADHAFSSATFSDLIEALACASGRNVTSWVEAWLATSGPSILEVEGDTLSQRANDVDPEATLRPHRLAVVSLSRAEDGPALSERRDIELDPVPAPTSLSGTEPIVVNATGATYAITRQDPRVWEACLDDLARIPDPQARAVLWLSLFDAARDGKIGIVDVLRRGWIQADREDPALRPSAIAGVGDLMAFIPRSLHDAVARPLSGAILDALEGADRTRLDAWVPHLCRILMHGCPTPGELDRLEALGTSPLLSLDQRWFIVRACAATGRWDAADIDAFYRDHDSSGRGRMRALAARSSLPGREAEVRERVWSDTSASNEEIDALLEGLWLPTREPARDAHRYCRDILAAWQARPLHMAMKVAYGAFPAAVDGGDGDAATHPAVREIADFVTTDMPEALRRVISQGLDHQRRRLARHREVAAASALSA